MKSCNDDDTNCAGFAHISSDNYCYLKSNIAETAASTYNLFSKNEFEPSKSDFDFSKSGYQCLKNTGNYTCIPSQAVRGTTLEFDSGLVIPETIASRCNNYKNGCLHPKDCISICNATPKCDAFSFGSGNCYFKKDVDITNPYKIDVSDKQAYYKKQ